MKNLNNKFFFKSLLLITFSFCLFSCSESPLNDDDDDNGSSSSGNKLKTGQIEIKAYPSSNNVIEFYATAKKITVNWGDGSVDEFTPNGVPQTFRHSYPNSNFQTITVNTENVKEFQVHGSKELRIGKCSELILLDSSYGLTVLEINDAPKLTSLVCRSSSLSSLDVSKCPALTSLNCGDSSLSSLDVSKCPALTSLSCDKSSLSSLDVSKCPALTSLDCRYCRLNANGLNDLFKSLPTRQKSENATIYIWLNPGTADCDGTIAEKKMWTVR